jgi:hypothetical protein
MSFGLTPATGRLRVVLLYMSGPVTSTVDNIRVLEIRVVSVSVRRLVLFATAFITAITEG